MESDFMSFRRALLGFALCCAAPTTVMAQQARQVEASYDITFLGFTGFRIDFSGVFAGGRYDVQSHTFKEGMMRAVTVHYDGRNRATGIFSPQGAVPFGGSLSIVVGDKPRTWVAQYGPGGTLQETHTPEWKPQPQQAIPEDKRIGSLDPLSAAMSVGAAGDAACDRTVPSNDGKRRIDVILKKVGTEPAATAGVPQAKGDLLICEIHTRRVAGEFDDAPKEAESERERPMKIWLARLDDTPFRYPVKLEASTGFGTIRGRMLSFRETPK
jgi:hypothetical protein